MIQETAANAAAKSAKLEVHVAKPSNIDDFFCFVVNYYDLLMPLKQMQILTTPFQENNFFRHPQLDLLVKFYCIFNALVRQNLQRWTGFDLLIISGVKF